MSWVRRLVLLGSLSMPGVAARSAAAEAPPPRPAAPHHVVANSEVRVLPVSSNGRAYQLYVGLPPSYGKQPNRRYPVLYICDGYWDFTLLNSLLGGLLSTTTPRK
jgi:hypothetical protein